MVSHSDCEKQHNLRQFNLLNVKPCTEAPSNIQHAKVRARVLLELKLNELKRLNVKLMQKKKKKSVFKAQSNIDALIEPY